MPPNLDRFVPCPLDSRSIETREDALSYYAHRLAGLRPVTVRGVVLEVIFPENETHCYSEEIKTPPCPAEQIVRNGSEERRFSKKRARRMDLILKTIEAPAIAVPAKDRNGIMLIGPADPGSAIRMAIVVIKRGERFHVRTSYEIHRTNTISTVELEG